ncbi:gamma-glutamyltransferase family protein [uncultured Brachyspira sp.]|uniref:gamma-glutamyltransferase family protein n=1 Tax=uncultured Brachyspira sp. TaxID=221953 RepID=UPI00260C95CA|nr:gamma-glutamyltransferase family protein [uncultured Brachyspira sp.]
MDFYDNRYASKRNAVFGKNIVATSNILASQAGIEIIKKGGNAVDAAIAAAAALTVVEPASNGIGGDAFAIINFDNKIYAINASGFSPKDLDVKKILSLNLDKMPLYGVIPVTVGGIPASWESLIKKFGRLKLIDVLEPAIRYAENGYAVQPQAALDWKEAYNIYMKASDNLKKEEFKYWFDTFTFNGKTPKLGEIVKLPFHAKTLYDIGKTNAECIYRGEYAERIDSFMKKYGGYLSKEDLSGYYTEFVNPITLNYRGYDIYEIPPNGHGITVLMTLNILSNFDFNDLNETDRVHYQIEALKLAFTDTKKYVSDINYMKTSIDEMLSKKYAEKRASLINKNKALEPINHIFSSGDTVYLAASDSFGNMVSYIQSNYTAFGSGIVIPETGIALQNRGANFSLDPSSDNFIAPHKKPYHTIIPAFICRDSKPYGALGIMGAFMQPQGHVQVISNLIDYNLNPQVALDKPRWQWVGSKNIELEYNFDNNLYKELLSLEHNASKKDYITYFGYFGRGQIIIKNDNDVYCAGCDGRTDSGIAVY